MSDRFQFDLGLRRTSRQAIAEIQSRLTGATPGQLAIADGGSGQLSLAEERGEGRVSMADEVPTDAEADVQWPTDVDSEGSAQSSDGDLPTDEEKSAERPRRPRETE
jgi:hypothetical protein